MSRIDKALEKAGLVPPSDKKTSGAAEEKELISAWDLDLSTDREPAEDLLRRRLPEDQSLDLDGPPERDSAESHSTEGAPRQQPDAAEMRDHDATAGDPESGVDEPPLRDEPAAPSASDEDFPGLPIAINRSFEDKLVAMPSMEFQSVEQFRRLAAMLHLMQGNSKLKTVLVTSALPAEGKTLTASNLALCLSGSYRRKVLLVDCDLRRPTVHELFEVTGETGLREWLRHTGPEGPAIHHVSKNLSVLPAGKPDPDPMGVLTSERMQELVSHASRKVDWVVLDSPPVGLLSDGHLLSAMADAVVLVVRAGHTPYADVEKAIEALGRDKIAGIVLNQVDPTSFPGQYGYNSYGYGEKRATVGA